MAEEWKKVETLIEQVKDYVNIRVSQVKLSTAEKTAKVVSLLIALLIAALIFFLFLVMIGIGIALLVGKYIGSTWLGFIIVAGAIALLGIWMWNAKAKLLQIPIMNSLIAVLFNDEENDHEKV
jgi:phosphotransferase system  glucose/maltose/N-acetylglucosamine-specific IIC component